MTKIEIRNLSYSYDKTAVLRNLNIAIESNTINILLGLNGSGKTTLIKLVVGLLNTTKERIFINGKDITTLSASALSKLIAYVPQDISSDNDFSVLDYLSFGRMNTIKFYASPKKVDFEKVTAIAKELNIEQLLDKKMNELSGGQRQLVVIARAVVQDSEIVIMDEPTSSIDYQYLNIVIKYLEVLKKCGKTILLSCHNPSMPLLLNSNVIVLEQGTMLMHGLARRLLTLETMKKIYKCELIEAKNLPYSEVSLCPID